ncbi:MAG TPA: flavodoxin [Lachnospiraceae bacterium]|nr:flavodoxin [Lachnospiraceae bacterium]
MKKRLLSLLIAGATIVGLLSGCGAAKDESNNSSTTQTESSAQVTDEPSEAAESGTDETMEASESGANETTEGKTLVVYYSATGTTEKVAGMIADATGGELYEIEPVEPYTDEDLDWTDSDSRVSREHENEDERDVELVSTTVDDFEDVSVVYLGYPVWWGIAAWPVDNFVKNNDFSGKTVIPFCTSSSSGIGDSGNLLAEMAGTGNWLEGERFSSSASAEDVRAWIESLGL